MRTTLIAGALVALLGACTSGVPKLPDDVTAEEVFALAEDRAAAGNPDAAIELYETVYEEFPAHRDLARDAQWKAAELAFAEREWKQARKIYQDFHETYRMVNLHELADRMYQIGEHLYEEGRGGLFGTGIFASRTEAIDTMRWITEQLRTSRFADSARMFMGRAAFDAREYEDAALEFQTLLEEYPESKWVFEARYLMAEAWFALNRGPAYDLGALLRARTAYQRYLDEATRTDALKAEHAERIAQAHARIAEVNERLAEKQLLVAEFYRSVERPASARIYLEAAVTDYPESEAAARAAALLEEMEKERE